MLLTHSLPSTCSIVIHRVISQLVSVFRFSRLEAIRDTVLGSQDHGSAQHRDRLFVIAIKMGCLCASLMLWSPPPRLNAIALPAFLDEDLPPEEIHRNKTVDANLEAARCKLGSSYSSVPDVVVDVAAGQHKMAGTRCPTITKCRGEGESYFLPYYGRMMKGQEIALLQGPAGPRAATVACVSIQDLKPCQEWRRTCTRRWSLPRPSEQWAVLLETACRCRCWKEFCRGSCGWPA